jgi:hypothetical protein
MTVPLEDRIVVPQGQLRMEDYESTHNLICAGFHIDSCHQEIAQKLS